MKRGWIRLILVVISLMILVGAYEMVEAWRRKKDETIMIDLNAIKPEAVQFNSLSLVPGGQCEYRICLNGTPTERYNVHFDFIETEEKTLKNFARVKILSDDEVLYDDLLASAFEAEDFVFKANFFFKDDIELVIVYYLPAEVGNEAKNAEAAFELLITATNE